MPLVHTEEVTRFRPVGWRCPSLGPAEFRLRSLLAGSLISLAGFLRLCQHLAELVLVEQLMRFQMFEGTSTPYRNAQRSSADRVGHVSDEDPVVGAEHPVDGLNRAAQRAGELADRGGPVAWVLDHARPCFAGIGEEERILRHGCPSPIVENPQLTASDRWRLPLLVMRQDAVSCTRSCPLILQRHRHFVNSYAISPDDD
jgi:hypothetical protein